MLFYAKASNALLVLTLLTGALAGPCMPCQPSKRRETPWDRKLLNRGVYTPKITNPTKASIWHAASDNVVTWDLQSDSGKPSKSKGTLLLGYLSQDGTDDVHLYYEQPLAANVDIDSGRIPIKCPKVEPRDNYIVVLIGDTGNRSPPFTITQ